jgi:thioredoxin-like negative regulator of GroEL
MVALRNWLCVCLLGLGCHSLPAVGPNPDRRSAQELLEQGQQAMRRGDADEAIRCFLESLQANSKLVQNHLGLAAAYLGKENPAEACTHLATYVDAHPEQWRVRLRYAQLLADLHRRQEAQNELERLVADAQEKEGTAAKHLIDCHSRLVELAEQAEDSYAKYLNRGIGLYLLARKRNDLPDPEGELSAEGLLCKAAAELTLARLECPEEARPCWYLYSIWSQLGQRQPALSQLRQAEASAPFSYLTPAEQRALHLAYQAYQAEWQRH